MAKHILFLVHGIGLHEKNWAEEPDGPIKTLEEASHQYAYFKTNHLTDSVRFVPITYDEIFREIVEQWQKDASAIDAFDTTGMLKGSLTWLEKADATGKNFWWTHVADLVLYRLFPIYRQRVRSHVIAEMANVIEEEMNSTGSATCSVLAHSMGTAVIHDCLHLLGTVNWGGHANPLSPTQWRFNHLFMVANTSRLLENEDAQVKKAYDSIVRPGPVEDPNSYCATYWNFRHEVDPVPFPRMFDPAGWPSYYPVLIRHYRELNIHNLSHYLINPRVHVPIFNKVVSRKAVTQEEETAAENRFPQFGGKLAIVEKAEKFIAKLETLKAGLGDDPAPEDLTKNLTTYYSLIGDTP